METAKKCHNSLNFHRREMIFFFKIRVCKRSIEWNQAGSCIFIRLEMRAKRRKHLLFAGGKKWRKKNHSTPQRHHLSIFSAHRAKSTKKWHQDRGVKLFEGWPGNSPDLNPIENLWSQMKHLQRHERATSIAGLKRIAQKVWNNITLAYLQSLYESMPRRMQAVVDAQGGHTKY